MRARALVLSVVSSAVVLVAGWQIGGREQVGLVADGTVPSGTSSAATGADETPTVAAGVSGTFTGASAQTRYGAVQVQITVQDGLITDVTALQLTDADNRSVSISNRAAPILRQEVLAAQSASVQGVSGATYTSDGYLTSLQSALDQAGL